MKRGVTPETNAVATMMLFVTLALLAIGQLALVRASRRSGSAADGGMAAIIAER